MALVASLNQPGAGPHVDGHAKAGLDLCLKAHITDPCAGQGLGKVVVSGVWLGVMGAWSLWILG